MKIKKVILFLQAPFCRRDYERFGVEILQKNGFDVEVWDCVSFLRNEEFKKVKVPDPINFEKYRIFSCAKEVKYAIFNLNKECFIIFFEMYHPGSYPIYRAVSKKKIPYGIITAGNSHPLNSMGIAQLMRKNPKKDNFKEFIKKYIKKVIKLTKFKHLKNYAIHRIPPSLLGIRPANLILADAEKSTFSSFPISINTEISWIHYFDYDLYLNESKEMSYVNKQTGVFLDSYLPFHPEWTLENIASPVTTENYYTSLCKFFDYLEKRFGVKIIIAAHPRSHYEKHPDFFGGRPIIRGQTAKLIKQAGFVLAHASFSINFAVLFKKPLLFLLTNEMEYNFEKALITTMAELFRKKPINIDKPFSFDWKNELSIDEERYAYYKHCYIKKTGTEELPYWQIVSNRLKQFERNRLPH